MLWALFSPLTLAATVPMSPCLYGRAVGGYTVPKAGSGSGVNTNYWGGTCGLANAQTDYPAWYANGYLAAPDDETYNGFPFTSPAVDITGQGVGKSCGECFQLFGDKGTIVVMTADVCDKGCCDNCQGSLGGPKGPADVPNFDVNSAVLGMLTDGNNGGVPIAYRKVSCDMAGTTPSPSSGMGIMLANANEGNMQAGYFRMRMFAHAVGVANVEVKGSAGGATGGNWTPLKKIWQGAWDWINAGDVGAPFQVRVTSILNETIELPNPITQAQLTSNAKFYFAKQFQLPPANYGGSSASCTWPGPDPVIYSGGVFGGDLLNKWGDYRNGGTVNFVDTVGCRQGRCISWGQDSAYSQLMIGFLPGPGMPLSYYSSLSFYVKAASAGTRIDVFWFYNSGSQVTSSKVTISDVPTTWTQFTFNTSQFFATSGRFHVLNFQVTSAIPSARYLQFDEIQFNGPSISRVKPIASPLLAGPPPIGFPGYTGPDPAGPSPPTNAASPTAAAQTDQATAGSPSFFLALSLMLAAGYYF